MNSINGDIKVLNEHAKVMSFNKEHLTLPQRPNGQSGAHYSSDAVVILEIYVFFYNN